MKWTHRSLGWGLLLLMFWFPVVANGAVNVATSFDLDRDGDVDGADLKVMTVSAAAMHTEAFAGNFGELLDGTAAVLTPTVMVVNFDPIMEDCGSARLTSLMGWNDVAALLETHVMDIREASAGHVNYVIVERHDVDAFPVKADGFQYADDTYLACQASGGTDCHNPDEVDYAAILDDFDVCGKLNRGEIDELWLFGGPWFGYYESRLAGPDAFWYNSSPITATSCERLLPIMGFNYERGPAEMLHDFGHRAEASMTRVFGGWDVSNSPRHDWDLYGHNLGQSDFASIYQCGTVHFPPNGTGDYDYGNTSDVVESACDDWLNYPNFTGATTTINCDAWNCDQQSYLRWWLAHLPRKAGFHEGKLLNWWEYIVGQRYDEIFPRVTAFSSEYASGWADLVLDGNFGTCNQYEWATAGEPTGWVEIAVNDDIAAISIYDRACPEQVLSGHVEFDDGTSIPFGTLVDDGQTATRLEVDQTDVAWIRIYIDESRNGDNPGIGEVVLE